MSIINYNIFINFIKDLFFEGSKQPIKSKDKLKSKEEYKKQFDNLYDSYCKRFIIDKQPDVLNPVERIIVIGDIHGDFELLKSSLKLASIIDDNDNWIGDKTVIVQVGDQIDRCRDKDMNCNTLIDINDKNDDWNILKYMTMLHNKAIIHGGAVYSLLGNHELMNADGVFTYVSKKGLDDFSLDKEYLGVGDETNIPNSNLRKWAFSRGKPISKFLACTRKMCIIIGSNIFVHAGILKYYSEKYNVTDINKIISSYLFDASANIKNDLLNPYESPLWTRDFVKNENCNELITPLDKFISKSTNERITQVGSIIIGHTPDLSGIKSKCDGKIWITDYGASVAFDKFRLKKSKKIQVLEIKNDNEIKILL